MNLMNDGDDSEESIAGEMICYLMVLGRIPKSRIQNSAISFTLSEGRRDTKYRSTKRGELSKAAPDSRLLKEF